MSEIRLGIVGLGNIGAQHVANVVNGAVRGCRIAAVASRRPRDGLPGRHYDDWRALVESGEVDALLVATPTWTHREIGLFALEHGLHVLMEKPLGLSSLEGEELVAAAAPGQVLAVMLNQRTDPVYREMQRRVAGGELGEIRRTHWTMTNWFRPDAYFAASEWRGTWRGEGGGLLMNQCVHNLDVFQWICGMPVRLTGTCAFGRHHDIEVEDEASAFLEYANGATGTFVGSTGEAPGFNRFDVVGSRATLSFDGERLVLRENDPAVPEFSRSTREMFGTPALTVSDVTPERAGVNQHALVLQDFVDAIASGRPPLALAADGLASLDLANAILLSAWRGAAVELPLDRAAYHAQLAARIERSRFRTPSAAEVVVDMSKSYR